ncbi:unnamed protein product [Staurois parvus]|uniref:Uncharacterized protein n=1 Tax=Staurois parvus TaxID=386267 RepID=A0ABN9EP83_9NEOB|nr:unnamed protein product [Staurois parvus]
MSYQEIRAGPWKKGRNREVRMKHPFYTMQRINPLGSKIVKKKINFNLAIE